MIFISLIQIKYLGQACQLISRVLPLGLDGTLVLHVQEYDSTFSEDSLMQVCSLKLLSCVGCYQLWISRMEYYIRMRTEY